MKVIESGDKIPFDSNRPTMCFRYIKSAIHNVEFVSSEISDLLENKTYSERAIFTFTLEKYSTYPLQVYPHTWVPIYLNAHCTANTMKEPNQLIIKKFKEIIYNRNLKKIKIQFKFNKCTFFAESR